MYSLCRRDLLSSLRHRSVRRIYTYRYLYLGTSCDGLCFVWSRKENWSRLHHQPAVTKREGRCFSTCGLPCPIEYAASVPHHKDNDDWILVGHGLRVQHSRGGGTGGRCVLIFPPQSHALLERGEDGMWCGFAQNRREAVFMGKGGIFRGLLS